MISNKFIIKTNKGYICEQNASGVYTKRVSDYYNHFMNGGGFFGMNGCSNDAVDKLGFTDDIKEATTYSSCIGNRVQEVVDRINAGFEDVKEITLKEHLGFLDAFVNEFNQIIELENKLTHQHEDRGE